VSEEPQPPAAPAPDEPQAPGAPPPRRPTLAAALPFLATAAAAVLLSLLAQALLWPPRTQPLAPTATPAAAVPPAPSATGAPSIPAPTAPGAPAATPGPATTPPRADERVLSLQILDLQEQNRQLWSAIYLLRAAAQVSDAVAALGDNDLDGADRTLLTVYRSLERAYAFSAEQEKGPIDTFRLEVSAIRDDLRVRPDGADRRLRQLRQLMLSLVDEGG
jgi:hypothetical protein